MEDFARYDFKAGTDFVVARCQCSKIDDSCSVKVIILVPLVLNENWYWAKLKSRGKVTIINEQLLLRQLNRPLHAFQQNRIDFLKHDLLCDFNTTFNMNIRY